MATRPALVMKSISTVLCVTAFATATLASAAAADKSVRLVTGPDYEPYTDPNLPSGGMVTEIVEKAFEAAGYHTSLEFHPWKRAYQATLANRYDAAFPWVITEKRQKEFAFSNSIHPTPVTGFTLAGSPLANAGVDSLKGHIVCRPAGYFMPSPLDEMIDRKAVRRYEPGTMSDCFRALLSGKSDAVITGPVEGRIDIATLLNAEDPLLRRVGIDGQEDIATLNWQADGKHLRLIVPLASDRRAEILSAFNDALAAMEENGQLEKIRKRHLRRFGL